MTDKEKADCFIELQKEQLKRFMQTRDIELKINIALWTAIIVSAFYCKEKIILDSVVSKCIYIVVSIALVLAHFYWLKNIQKSEDTDKHYFIEFRKAVVTLTEMEIEKHKGYFIKSSNWVNLQTAVTILLLIVGYIYFEV